MLRKAYQNAKKDSNLNVVSVVSTVLTAVTTSSIVTAFTGYVNAVALAGCIGLVSVVSNEVYRRTIKTTHLVVSAKSGKSPAEMFTSNTANSVDSVGEKTHPRFFTKHFGLQFILLFFGVSLVTTGIFFVFDKDTIVVEKQTVKVVTDSNTKEQVDKTRVLTQKNVDDTTVLGSKVNKVESKLEDVEAIKNKVDRIDSVESKFERMQELEKQNRSNNETIDRLSREVEVLRKQVQDLNNKMSHFDSNNISGIEGNANSIGNR